MKEFRVKGLSCPNCTQTLENEIQRLEHGQSASLSYASGRLKLDERVSLDRVRRILKTDGAWLEPPNERSPGGVNGDGLDRGQGKQERDHSGHDHAHEGRGHAHGGHDHAHGGHEHTHGGESRRIIALLIASTVVYLGTMIAGSSLPAGVSIALYAAAAIASGYSTFWRGLRNLLRLRFNIDTLMTIALVGAAAIGDWKEATLVAILFGLNELLEGFGMETARRSMESLLQAAPKTATRLAEGIETVVPIDSLRAGDLVIVKPGEKIPSDGTVAGGRSSVNEAAITGESLPVDKREGDAVFGGSINNDGVLRVRIDRAYENSSLATILHLVSEAQETKTPTELFINRFAKYYTPFIIIAAILVIVVPPLLLGGSWIDWLYQGLAVLIVGCPCALILSSPIAIVAGIARNARNGVLIKGGAYLEQLGKLDTLAFDKTGTLTEGRPAVRRTIVYDEARFYPVAYAIERQSLHPLAQAVVREAEQVGADVASIEADEIEALPGIGVKASVGGTVYRLGNESSASHLAWTEEWQDAARQLKDDGLTLVVLSDDRGVLGMFGIADSIRAESREVVAELRRSGIRRTVMLTGDHKRIAEQVAEAVGVDEVAAGLLPQDKLTHVRKLAEDGAVGMVGDGINDAPALAAARLGIAMGRGTDSAIETADIVLMQDHLGKLPEAIRIARRVNRIIRFNLAVALGLKLVALLLTIPGWLTLWIAILSDMGATVFVTLVSLTVLVRSRTKGHDA